VHVLKTNGRQVTDARDEPCCLVVHDPNSRLKPQRPRYSDMDFLCAIETCRDALAPAPPKDVPKKEEHHHGAGQEQQEEQDDFIGGTLDYRSLTEDLAGGLL